MQISIQELKKVIQNFLFEDTQLFYTPPAQYVKSEVNRYLDFYHSQYFTNYSKDDVKRLFDRVKNNLQSSGESAEIKDEDILKQVKKYLDKNTYDIQTIINRTTDFVMDSIRKSEPKEISDFANKNKLFGANLKNYIFLMTQQAISDYLKANNYIVVNNKVVKSAN